jgi:hypothetical protein
MSTPSTPTRTAIHIRLPDAMIEAVDAAASRARMSRSEAFRELMRVGLEHWGLWPPEARSKHQSQP